MRSVTLGGSSVRCSVLGFGCVKLTVQRSRAEAVRTLNCALDHGITHFDVARLYGFGQAEGILGEFLHGKRDGVTVTTKFGLRPSQSIAKHRRLISIARQVLRRVPFIERCVKRGLASSGGLNGIFTPQEAATSLDISLRELGTDYVDVFLMHEATPDAVQPELLAHLDEEVKRGRIRTYGLGTQMTKLATNLAGLPASCQVLQFDSSALAPHVMNMQHLEGRGIITFGVMAPLRPLLDYAMREPAQVQTLSDQAQLHLANPAVLSGLIIDDAVRANPAGVTLVATVNPEHVAANARAAGCQAFTEPQRTAFRELLKRVAADPARRSTSST